MAAVKAGENRNDSVRKWSDSVSEAGWASGLVAVGAGMRGRLGPGVWVVVPAARRGPVDGRHTLTLEVGDRVQPRQSTGIGTVGPIRKRRPRANAQSTSAAPAPCA